ELDPRLVRQDGAVALRRPPRRGLELELREAARERLGILGAELAVLREPRRAGRVGEPHAGVVEPRVQAARDRLGIARLDRGGELAGTDLGVGEVGAGARGHERGGGEGGGEEPVHTDTTTVRRATFREYRRAFARSGLLLRRWRRWRWGRRGWHH